VTPDDAFLQSIIESPDDDSPRLIYADYLEEHGQPERAEFIRLQCQRALMRADDLKAAELEAREQELLKEHEEEWAKPWKGLAEKWEFHRGFIEAVRLEPQAFLTHAPTLLASTPVLLAELGAEWGDTPRLLSLLEASPFLKRLRSVYLYFCFGCVSDAGLGTLSQSPLLLQRLGGLVVSDCHITEAGLQPVVMAPLLARLRLLFLCGCGLQGEAAALLLTDSPCLDRLTHLGLSDNELGDATVQVLVRSPSCGGLEGLDLDRCGLTDTGAQALTDTPHLERLKWLRLAGNGISEAARGQLQDRFGDRVHF
jgi:uncharacterized protein (TIGR02996 family)